MASMIPVEGGQYRFAYKCDINRRYIGVFHSYVPEESSFAVDMYVEALTPESDVPNKFIGLLGLPDLKRDDERTRVGVKVNEIVITDRLYICKNSLFQERRIQWRLGIRNLYRISDDEADEHSVFVGYDDKSLSYINEESEYLAFKMILVKNFNEKLRSTIRTFDEEFFCEPVAKYIFLRLAREIDSWEVYFKEHCTKKDDSWSNAVMHTTGVKIDRIPRDEQSIQIPYVPMLQPILGDTYWYFIWNLPRLKASKRECEQSYICALPVCDCNLVFRLDRISHQLRVQFRIRKGNYNVVVDELRRGEERVQDMRAQLVGKWIKDTIDDIDTWLLVVAVEINTENVVSTNKRYASKKQEIFGAKAVAFALSQFDLRNSLPLGVELKTEPNQFGALLNPRIYRDINISCMYLLDDISDDMLVPADEVPEYQQAIIQQEGALMSTPKGRGNFKLERKSDFSPGTYEASIKKVRKIPEYPIAKGKVTNMLGNEGDADEFQNPETMYVLRCLDTECSSTSLFAGLSHYRFGIINSILQNDFKYHGEQEVTKSKDNLLIVCESFLNAFNTDSNLNALLATPHI